MNGITLDTGAPASPMMNKTHADPIEPEMIDPTTISAAKMVILETDATLKGTQCTTTTRTRSDTPVGGTVTHPTATGGATIMETTTEGTQHAMTTTWEETDTPIGMKITHPTATSEMTLMETITGTPAIVR